MLTVYLNNLFILFTSDKIININYNDNLINKHIDNNLIDKKIKDSIKESASHFNKGKSLYNNTIDRYRRKIY